MASHPNDPTAPRRHRSGRRHLRPRREPLGRLVLGPPPHGQQGPGPLPRHRGPAGDRRRARAVERRGDHRRQPRSTAATPSATSTCARPTSSTPSTYPHRHVPLDQGRGPRRRRVHAPRRPDRSRRHPPRRVEGRVPRNVAVAVGRHAHRLQRRDRDQPQGLGTRVERRARDRRRRRRRQDQARRSTPSGSSSNAATSSARDKERVRIRSWISTRSSRA